MYTIKNTSSKIIHIGTKILMPDMTMKAPAAIATTPAVNALAKRKMLEVTAPVVEAPKQDEDPKQGEENGEQSGEQAGEDQAPAETAKGTRRTTRKAAAAKE